MKILTISNAAWDDCNSVGNTQSNWFSGWDDLELYSMYTRQRPPNNMCCSHYYSVTIKDILKHLFCWKAIGEEFEISSESQLESSNIESRAVSGIKGWKKNVLQFLIEIIYSSQIWLNRKMKVYLQGVDPDIVFCFAIAEPFRYNVLKYIKAHSGAKIVMWIADDVYGQAQNKGEVMRRIYLRRYHRLFSMADKLYGVSEMLCNEYSQIFNRSIIPLYKGCEFSPCREVLNTPLQMVYAGNLLYGRDSTLAKIAEQLKILNQTASKIQLFIYSTTAVPKDTLVKLNIKGSSQLCGAKPYKEILEIMNKADIALHVESFDENQIKKVRLSFSTKIIDCMQSGAVMMVIGPRDIASVEYPRSIPGVIVIDELENISHELQKIVEEPSIVLSKAIQLRRYALENHAKKSVQTLLQEDFYLLINK